jgi:hypothetical protein
VESEIERRRHLVTLGRSLSSKGHAMSWDVVILKIRGEFRPIEEVEEGDFLPLGELEAVQGAVRSAFPAAEWSNPTWAVYLGPDFEFEIDLNNVESSNSVHLFVHGTGDPIPSLLGLTEANGWLMLDCSTGEFLDPKNPSYEGWEGFKDLNQRGSEGWS